jgi:hypothetical protein
VIVLNTDAAVQAFSRGGNVTIGVDLSAAAGPWAERGRRSLANSGCLHLQQEQRPFRWRVIGRGGDWNAKAIQFQLLRKNLLGRIRS